MTDIERTIRDVLNATEVESLVTVKQVDQLVEELTSALNDTLGL